MEIKGISKDNVLLISKKKREDSWILDYRMDSYNKFERLELPKFGPEISFDFSSIIYYKSNDNDEVIESDWNSVLKPVRDELDSLGVCES